MAIPAPIAAAGINAGSNILSTLLGPRIQYKWNKRAMNDANVLNRANQDFIFAQERALQEEQRQYDSPAAQMARYKAAGLNPHLIYGSGSSAGSAFPINVPSLPAARLDPPQAGFPDIGGSFIRGSQAYLQAENIQAKTEESYARQQSIAIQNEIAKTNPMLRPEVAATVSDALLETSRLKALEAWRWTEKPDDENQIRVWKRIEMEIEAQSQKLGLNTVDLAIRNKILESKEFENVVKELNAKWLQDSQVTPEHIRQGLMLLLSKMLR